MKLLFRLLSVMTMSAVIAFGLSQLPDIQEAATGANGELTVFRNMKPVTLTGDNLVDWLIGMPAKLELDKVDWSHRMLALDFRLDGSVTENDRVYAQLMDSVRYGLSGTNNVERVQIRVFDSGDSSGEGKRLFLALEAHRSQYNEGDYMKWRESGETTEQWLSRHFQLTLTNLWKMRISE